MKNTLVFCFFALLAVATPLSSFACGIPSGLKAAFSGTTATLTWDAVGGAESYRLEIENALNNPVLFHAEAASGTTSYTVTGLTAGQNYKFKVRAVCNGDKDKWSEWSFFAASSVTTTGGGGSTGTCDVPVQLNTQLAAGKLQLNWGAVTNAVSYSIEIENASGNNVPSHFTATVTTNNFTPANLTANGMYKYKVRTNCSGGQSAWSAWLLFNASSGASVTGSTGNACGTPTGLSMNVGATAGSAFLVWNAVPGAVSYQIEAENAAGNTTVWKATANTSTSPYTLTGLSAGRNYKFKVRAVCSGGQQSQWANWVVFNATTGTPGTPGTPGNNGNLSCAVPSGMGVQAAAASAALSWSAVAGATSYQVEVESASNATPVFAFTATVSLNTYTIAGLKAGGTYKWKVRSVCNGNTGNWSAWNTFSTPLQKPASSTGNVSGTASVIKVFPNPVQSATLTLQLESFTEGDVALRILDGTGAVIWLQSATVAGDIWQQAISLPDDLQHGVYYLQAIGSGKILTVKFAK